MAYSTVSHSKPLHNYYLFPFFEKIPALSINLFTGLELWDSLRHEMYRDTDVFLICFDIGNPATLKSAVDLVSDLSLHINLDNISNIKFLIFLDLLNLIRRAWLAQFVRSFLSDHKVPSSIPALL